MMTKILRFSAQILSGPVLAAAAWAASEPAPLFDYNKLILVEKVDCGSSPDSANFKELPKDASKVEEILGKPCRVLANDSRQMKYFAYNLGKGKGLKPGAAYVLAVDYPDDKPRQMFILNRGNETGRGFSTGNAVPDGVFGLYVDNNAESIQYPQSGAWQRWQHFFYLHDRFPKFDSLRGEKERGALPEDGFWVLIAQMNKTDSLGSNGAAVGTISLYEVPNPEQYAAKINYPPANLPRRYLFCREEMADGVISVPHGKDKPQNRGLDDPTTWYEYKARNMLFLGMNTFTTDLLEFGHNQGWDSGPDDSWFFASSTPKNWENLLTMLQKYPALSVLPYYEYGGATNGIGKEQRTIKLKGDKKYTQLDWINNNAHVNILDPASLEDAKKILDATVLRFKDQNKFVGAWFRPRPVQMPISFQDSDLAMYKSETGTAATRDGLKADATALQAYYGWWFKKREAFLAALSQYLRDNGVPSAVVLFTFDTSEPGQSLRLKENVVVTDDTVTWEAIMAAAAQKKPVVSFDMVVQEGLHGKALQTPPGTYGEYEWQHSCPWGDPADFKDQDKALLTYTFNRLYTVSNPAPLEEFRTGAGLAVVRHYSLNENIMDNKIGYFACDSEPEGAYSMMGEARAMANGDPRFIGYLFSNTVARGFPQYTREFNRAFLALPALPSKVTEGISADKDVVVRTIDAGSNGLYLALVNVALTPKKAVALKLPKTGVVTNAGTGQALTATDGKMTLDFYPGQLYAVLIKEPAPEPVKEPTKEAPKAPAK